jgi:hypothetical protein
LFRSAAGTPRRLAPHAMQTADCWCGFQKDVLLKTMIVLPKAVPDPAQVRRAMHCLKSRDKANLVFKSK